MITIAQCRAGRALLDWSREDLSAASKVSLRTIVDFERGARAPRELTLDAIERALVDAGVQLIPENGGGAGVRLAKPGSGHAASRDHAVSLEQQKANADDVRTEAADAVDRVLAETAATNNEKAERRGALTDEPRVIATARGKGNPKRGNS